MLNELGASKHIESLLQDKEARLKDLDAELARLAERKAPEAVAEKVKARRESIVAAYDRQIERAKEALDQAVITGAKQTESNTKRFADKARAAEDALKRQARLSYIANGGSPESFEAAWPELRTRLISDKVSSEVNTGRPRITL